MFVEEQVHPVRWAMFKGAEGLNWIERKYTGFSVSENCLSDIRILSFCVVQHGWPSNFLNPHHTGLVESNILSAPHTSCVLSPGSSANNDKCPSQSYLPS